MSNPEPEPEVADPRSAADIRLVQFVLLRADHGLLCAANTSFSGVSFDSVRYRPDSSVVGAINHWTEHGTLYSSADWTIESPNNAMTNHIAVLKAPIIANIGTVSPALSYKALSGGKMLVEKTGARVTKDVYLGEIKKAATFATGKVIANPQFTVESKTYTQLAADTFAEVREDLAVKAMTLRVDISFSQTAPSSNTSYDEYSWGLEGRTSIDTMHRMYFNKKKYKIASVRQFEAIVTQFDNASNAFRDQILTYRESLIEGRATAIPTFDFTPYDGWIADEMLDKMREYTHKFDVARMNPPSLSPEQKEAYRQSLYRDAKERGYKGSYDEWSALVDYGYAPTAEKQAVVDREWTRQGGEASGKTKEAIKAELEAGSTTGPAMPVAGDGDDFWDSVKGVAGEAWEFVEKNPVLTLGTVAAATSPAPLWVWAVGAGVLLVLLK